MSGLSSNNNLIQVSALPVGFYILKIQTDTVTMTGKFVKK